MELFFKIFNAMFIAIIEIFIVAFIAGVLVRKNIINQSYIQGLAEITVKVLLPAMIFDNITQTFDPINTTQWWLLPLIGLIAPAIFLIFIVIFYLPNYKKHINKFALATFQNGGYLVLPIGQILYRENFNQFALYVFLLTMGLGIILWTLGKFLITQEQQVNKIQISDLITPPFVAIVFSMLLVLLGINKYIPQIIIEPMHILGSATVPIATFVLGATIGTISFKKLPHFYDILKIASVKYIIIPTITISILTKTGLAQQNHLLSDFLVIEASAAPAANLIVMVRKYGGNEQQTSSIMFIMYFLAILTMPLTIAIWKTIN